MSRVDRTTKSGLEPLSKLEFKILESLSKVDAIRDFRLKELMSELGMDTKQPALFYRELVKEARNVIASLHELNEQLADAEKSRDQALIRISSLEQSLKDSMEQIVSLEKDNNQLRASVPALRTMASSFQALKAVLIAEASAQVLENLLDLIHGVYMKKLASEISRSPSETDSKQVEVLRQKLREELRTVLQVPETSLEKELAFIKEQNKALTSALLTLSRR